MTEYNLFIWENNNICYSNNTNIYKNVTLNTGSIVKGEFENQICTTILDNKIRIIENCNYYINGFNWGDGYNKMYKIYDNIKKNFNQIITDDIINYDYENIKFFYFINPFMFSNSGHDLSTMLNNVDYIIKNNIKNIIIIKGYKNSNNYKLLVKILPEDINIVELLPETKYYFKEIIILPQMIMDINCHKYLIEKLNDIILKEYSSKYSDYKNKKILLIKSNRNPNVMLNLTTIYCDKLITELEKKNYLYIIPEQMDIYFLALLLMHANKIVFSTGSILYTNKIFFNKNSTLYYITHKNNINCCTDGINTNNLHYIFYEDNVFDDEKTNEILNILD